MITIDDAARLQLKTSQFMALAMFVAAPIIYLGVGYFIDIQPMAGHEGQLVFYILFIVAMAQPLVLPIIEKAQIRSFRSNPRSQMTPAQLFLTVNIIKFAMVESIFLYAIVVRILLGDFNNMLYFYAVGIIWAAVYWPRMSALEKFLEKVEQNGFPPAGR